MKRINLAIVFTILGSTTARPITLPEALQEALANHPALAVFANRIEAAAGKREQAALRPNPLFLYQSEDFRTWGNPGHRFWQDADHFFYLQQTFETASKRARRVDVAAATARRSEIELIQQRQTIAGRVRAAYWEAAGFEYRSKLLLRALDSFAEITRFHRDQVREGALAEADLLRVELEEQKLMLLANSASSSLSLSAIRLQREMGRAALLPITLDSPLETATPAAPPLAVAIEQRADAQLARQIIRLASAQTDLERALATPNFDGVAGYKRSGPFDTVLWGVQVPLPVFNRNQGNVASASAEERLAQNALTSTEAIIRAEFESATTELNLRGRYLSVLIAPLRERSRQIASLAQSAYRLGGTDLLRLLDAQRQSLDTEQLYVDALLALRQAEASLLSAVGATQ